MSDNVLLWPRPTRIGADAIQLVKGAMSLARRVVHELVDDIDGDAATETVKLSYRGVDYEVDLSARNAAALDEALAPYLRSARRASRSRAPRSTTAKSGTTARSGTTAKSGRTARSGTSAESGRTARSGTDAPDPKEVRRWARSEGIEISNRGRVPADVTRRYLEVHGS